MKHQKFRIRTGASLCVCLLLVGCSRLEWVVKFSDTYIAWKVNDAFGFQGEAKSTIKAESAKLILRFRQSKFPFLSRYFRKSAQEVSRLDFHSEEALNQWVGKKLSDSDEFLDSLSSELEPFAMKVASLTNVAYWNSFLKNFEKENKKILSTKSKCVSKFEDQLEDWLGNLNDDQEKAIEAYCHSRSNSQEIRVKNRNFILETFRQWAEPKNEFDPASFASAVQRWVHSYRKLQHPESADQWRSSKENLKKAFVEILLKSSEAQKKKFMNEISERAETFQRFSL